MSAKEFLNHKYAINKFVTVADAIFIMIFVVLFIFGRFDKKTLEVGAIFLAVMAMVIQTYTFYIVPKEKLADRIIYVGWQLLFLSHFILFNMVAISNYVADMSNWSAMLRLHFAITFALKERSALARHIYEW